MVQDRNIEVGNMNMNEDSSIHIRYDGESYTLTFNDLEIDNTAPDNTIKSAIVEYLNLLDNDAFDKYVIEHHDNGDITVRPEAVFG